jgi:hypothetical protein
MGQRTTMTAADLFVLLDREFRRRKPRECGTCFVQLPYRIDVMGTGDANWELMIPPPCSFACASLLEDIASEYQARYDLAS